MKRRIVISAPMGLHAVKKAHEFADLKPVFITVGKLKIAVYRSEGKFYAYLDRCPHQGGPVCEGIVVAKVETETASNGTVEKRVSKDSFNIACPWHAYEYDLRTGICSSNSVDRLRSYEVVIQDENVLVKI